MGSIACWKSASVAGGFSSSASSSIALVTARAKGDGMGGVGAFRGELLLVSELRSFAVGMGFLTVCVSFRSVVLKLGVPNGKVGKTWLSVDGVFFVGELAFGREARRCSRDGRRGGVSNAWSSGNGV